MPAGVVARNGIGKRVLARILAGQWAPPATGPIGDPVTTPSSQLSGGERPEVALALARCRAIPVELLPLDEPTHHLDLQTIQAMEHPLVAILAPLMVWRDAAFAHALGLDTRLQVEADGWQLTRWVSAPARAPAWPP